MWFSFWLRNWKPSDPSQRRRVHGVPHQRTNFRPRLEALEDRTLPSTFYAATTSDLIADINAANKAGGANTIVLTAPTASPYVLTAVNNTTNGANGLPVISGGGKNAAADNLTIIGNGDTIERSTASGTPAFRLFDVANGGSLTLQSLTVQNGLAFGSGTAADGGAIYNQGTLVLSAVLLQNNVAEGNIASPTKKNPNPPGYDAAGGGLWSNGSLTLESSTVIQYNSAVGGQSVSAGPGGNAFGGGIDIAGGTANITGTTFSSNTAQGGAASGDRLSVGGSGYGGAVYVAGGTVTLSGDTLGAASVLEPVGGNTASGGSGLNSDYGNGNGGALYVAAGIVTLTNDYVIGNRADGSDDFGGPYTGGIFIASGATVYLDSFTDITDNSTYSEPLASYQYDPQIVGAYTLI